MLIEDIIDLKTFPLGSAAFSGDCRTILAETGVLKLDHFIRPKALAAMLAESKTGLDDAYFCTQSHSAYLTPHDPAFADDHPANRRIESSKGCICDDQVGAQSPLRILYDSLLFQGFIAQVTGEDALYAYADPLSSINVHYAHRGQELGWHFDNSSFAITLLIQKPDGGSRFEYVKDQRDADAGDMNYAGVRDILDGTLAPDELVIEPGTLVLFRGRNSIHRVSHNESDKTRLLDVLA